MFRIFTVLIDILHDMTLPLLIKWEGRDDLCSLLCTGPIPLNPLSEVVS
jgi:hypothetical protein